MYATSKNGHYHQQVEPTHQRSLLRRATMTATTTGLETQMRLEFQLFWNMTTMTTTIFTMMREARDIGGEDTGAGEVMAGGSTRDVFRARYVFFLLILVLLY